MRFKAFLYRMKRQQQIRVAIKERARQVFKQDKFGNIALGILPIIIILIAFLLVATIFGGTFKVSSLSLAYIVLVGLLISLIIFGFFMFYGNTVMQYQSYVQMHNETQRAHPWQALFKSYFKGPWLRAIFKIYFFMALFTGFWYLLPTIVDKISTYLSQYMFTMILSGGNTSGLIGWIFVLRVLSFILWLLVIYKVLGYSFAPLIMRDTMLRGEKIKGRLLLKRSSVLIKDHRSELIMFFLSFFWWWILFGSLVIASLWISNTWIYIVVGMVLVVLWFYLASYVTLSWVAYYDRLLDYEAHPVVVEKLMPTVVVERLKPRR